MIGPNHLTDKMLPSSYRPMRYEPSTSAKELTTAFEVFPERNKIQRLANGTGAEITPHILFICFATPFASPKKIVSHNSKVTKLRDELALNITELSSIFLVKRPTIYEWLDANGNPSLKNKKRIDIIYNLLDPLILQNAIEFKKYLHNEASEGDKLYDLLTNTKLNKHRISMLVKNILENILLSRKKRMAHKNKLQAKGFESISEDHKNKVRDRLTRKIG